MSRGRLLHSQPKDAPCHGDRDPHNMNMGYNIKMNLIEICYDLKSFQLSVLAVYRLFREAGWRVTHLVCALDTFLTQIT
jgi:hypothetical protein